MAEIRRWKPVRDRLFTLDAPFEVNAEAWRIFLCAFEGIEWGNSTACDCRGTVAGRIASASCWQYHRRPRYGGEALRRIV